jgi:hypothetical protein
MIRMSKSKCATASDVFTLFYEKTLLIVTRYFTPLPMTYCHSYILNFDFITLIINNIIIIITIYKKTDLTVTATLLCVILENTHSSSPLKYGGNSRMPSKTFKSLLYKQILTERVALLESGKTEHLIGRAMVLLSKGSGMVFAQLK